MKSMKSMNLTLKRSALALLVVVAIGGYGAAQDQAQAAPPAEAAIETASYQLFPVEGSDVSGALNVTQRVEGGTQFVVTLVGITEGRQYLPVLFRGDCGPDRERVRALPPVGSIEGDPFVSISETEMDFAEVTEGDYFLYVYRGAEPEGQPLACGEVGAGANR